jgi:carboxypeptidase Q
MTRFRLALLVPALGFSLSAAPGAVGADEKDKDRDREREKVDLAAIHRIKAEAFQGQVMDHLFWLTDANGPRLTGSPGWRSAAEWALKSLRSWGAAHAELEPWGNFGRGWSLARVSVNLVAPASATLRATPLAWSGATPGAVTAELVLAPMAPSEEGEGAGRDVARVKQQIQRFIDAYKGKLRGKIVLLERARDLELPKEIAATRLDDPKLAALGADIDPAPAPPYTWPIADLPADRKQREALMRSLPLEVQVDYWDQLRRARQPLWAFLKSEGAVAALTTDRRGDGGLIFAESVGAWDPAAPVPPPVLAMAPEAYNRLVRLVEKKVPVKLEIDVQSRFHDEDKEGYNVIAEIPGGKKRDEIVMLGAHLDSWHAGTGATDNGAGSAVALEAFRILKALNLPMDRTVRLALWSGEEEGLLGSRGYVKRHFADPVTMALHPEHAKLAAYFNLDNGTGKVRGVYLQGNDMVRPIFEAWLAPFRDEGATTLSIRKTGGTDHLSFDAAGLPGFQFIQDPLDYSTRTHHSELDVYDHAQAGDLMQAAAIMAAFVYHAANRPEMLPRKPLPKKLPPRTDARSEPQPHPGKPG